MTEWVLITMICMRNCAPDYAEVFPTKAACMARVTKPESHFSLPTHYCVPKVKDQS